MKWGREGTKTKGVFSLSLNLCDGEGENLSHANLLGIRERESNIKLNFRNRNPATTSKMSPRGERYGVV